jgi:hypothetical protein
MVGYLQRNAAGERSDFALTKMIQAGFCQQAATSVCLRNE